MTSDSELDPKYSSTTRTIDTLTTSKSQCPEGQLRCVSGNCISVDQICDKATPENYFIQKVVYTYKKYFPL